MSRQRFEFWLDDEKPEEKELMAKVEALKARNKFAATVRKGVMLIPELEAGNFETLIQMYPDVVQKLIHAINEKGVIMVASPPKPPPAPNTTELAKEIATQIILQGGADKILMQSTGQQTDSNRTGQGVKMLTQQQFALPTFDEDEAETQEAIAVTKNTGVDSFGNFLANASGVANFLGGISALSSNG